jgi:hypothetical protein
VFLTKFNPNGRLSPVQVPAEYAALPQFGLASFQAEDNVQALRLYSEPLLSASSGKRDSGWDLWLSIVTAINDKKQQQCVALANSFCPKFTGTFYLVAHAVPTGAHGAERIVPVHAFVLPSAMTEANNFVYPDDRE